MNEFKILLQAVIDSSNIGKSDIEKVQKVLEKYHLNLTADLNKAELIKTIKHVIPELESELKKITGVEIKINDKTLTKAIDQVIKDERRLQSELDRTAKKAEETQRKLQNKSNKIQISIGDEGSTTAKIKTLTDNFTKLGLSGEQVQNKMSKVTSELDKLKSVISTGDNNAIVSQFNKLKSTLTETTNSYNMLRSEQSLLITDQKRLNLANTIEAWNQKNTKATNEARATNDGYIKSLRDLDTQMSKMQFGKIQSGFKTTENSMRLLGRLGASFKNQLSQAAKSFTTWLSVSSAIMLLIHQIRKIPQEVYKVDKAMVNLRKVTDETSSKYTHFLDSANKKAQELGRSVSSLVEQTASWAKLGFNIDQASNLAATSSIYANVGEVDDETAISDIVTSIKAFNIEANDSIQIIDSLNKLGNEFATTSAGLGEGLRNSASSLALAGNDINQSLAMITGMTEITQNASESGNAVKILSMRLRGMKGELEELGEEYENVESISKIQTQILNRTKGTVNIFDDAGNFRSTYEIIKDIADVWDQISQTDQADLLEIIAGKQRGNSIAALIQSFQSGQAQKALEASINSSGSAQEEQDKWMQGLEARIQKLTAAFQKFSQTIANSDFLKNLVDGGTKFINILDGIIGKIGALPLLIGGIGSNLLSKNGLDYRKYDTTQILQGSDKSYCYG